MPLLEVEGLVKHFVRRRLLRAPVVVHALNEVSFTVGQGESVGLVGESGSGKTTAARCILRLATPTAGEIRFDGAPIHAMSGSSCGGCAAPFNRCFRIPTRR